MSLEVTDAPQRPRLPSGQCSIRPNGMVRMLAADLAVVGITPGYGNQRVAVLIDRDTRRVGVRSPQRSDANPRSYDEPFRDLEFNATRTAAEVYLRFALVEIGLSPQEWTGRHDIELKTSGAMKGTRERPTLLVNFGARFED